MDSKSELLKSALSPSTTITTEDANTLNNSSSSNGCSVDSSDLLASWTVVNNKENNKSKNENHDHIEVLKRNSDSEENDVEHIDENPIERFDEAPNSDSDVHLEEHSDDSLNKYSYEDGSDSVSVISDSDNVNDRFLYKNNMTESHLRRNSNFSTPDGWEGCLTFDRKTQNHLLTNATKSVLEFSYSITKRGLSCAVYVAIGIALLGFLGHIFNTSWQPLPAVMKYFPAIDQLEQRINEMELQNNLMRAEIDLLNKQIKYLSTFNNPQQQKPAKSDKVFKAWPGNGDSLKPIDITKQDLKKPYKCQDGSYVDIISKCMKQDSTDDPSLVDQFGEALEKLRYESEAFKTFEELKGSKDDAKAESNLHPTHKHHKNGYKNDNGYKKFSGKDNSHEWKKNKFGRRGSSETHDYDDSNEWQEKRMKGREELRNKNKSGEDDDDSGEWHATYMKHREQQRKKNEYKDASYERREEQQRKSTEQKNQHKKIWA